MSGKPGVGYHPSHPGHRLWATRALDSQVPRGQEDGFFRARSSNTSNLGTNYVHFLFCKHLRGKLIFSLQVIK